MNFILNKLHIFASFAIHKPHVFVNPVTKKPRTKIFFIHTSCGGGKCRVFKKMWYVIPECLNTHGRIGSKLEP